MKIAHGKCSESINGSKSNTTATLPWCSSGKVSRRKLVPKCEIQSSYTLRENNWEHIYDGENFKCGSKVRNRKVRKRQGGGKTKTVLCLLLIAGITGYLWRTGGIPTARCVMDKLISRTKVLSSGWKAAVSGECCHRMKYLEVELSRAEHNLRHKLRLRHVMQTHSISEGNSESYIHGAIATKGSVTEEWGSLVTLWGIVPLWKVAPSPDTVLSLRNPTPADCWPFSGSTGELKIHLPNTRRISKISVEHVRPDTAKSAPKHFTIHGVLANNTLVKIIDNQYQRNGPAKQFFPLGTSIVIRGIIFRVLTNHGNNKYTCIYRIHLYESNDQMDIFS